MPAGLTKDIHIQKPDGGVDRVALEGDSLSIGRAGGNDLSYPDDVNLSRRHLVLDRTPVGWSIRDLGSKNGTRVNGERITDVTRLAAGDKITAGHLVMVFDPSGAEASKDVVFVPDAGEEAPVGATVMTSLAGVLSSESTLAGALGTPGARPEGPARGAVPYDHPAVAALIWAGRELASHRPLEELFELILDRSISAVGADRGVLMTLEGTDLLPRAVRGEGFRISTSVRDKVLNAKTSLLVRDTSMEDAFREAKSIIEHNVKTMIAVPLQTEERVIGLIYVDSPSFMREFTREDLNLLTVMANVAAIRIEHQRLAEVEAAQRIQARDLEQAAVIQRGLLPSDVPRVEGLDLAAHNIPCRTVGGDYYEFFPYKDGKISVVLGDVSGKGLPAALLASSLQSQVQVLAEEPGDLGALMSRLDRGMAKNCPSNRFITFFFAYLDPKTGDLAYCNAGHNPPLVMRSDGRLETLEGGGTVLGMLPELGYEELHAHLDPGDTFSVYSDGISEAVNAEGEEFGDGRVAEALSRTRNGTAREALDAVRSDLAAWTGGAPPFDDATIVVVRRTH